MAAPIERKCFVSTLAVVLIAVAVLFVLFLAGGVLGARRRAARDAPVFDRNLQRADRALEVARAGDREWDPEVLERTAREALARSHRGTEFESVQLVLVDDQAGVAHDRAHYEAHAGDERVRVILTRDESGWHGETAG
jgi:hypothetical protein